MAKKAPSQFCREIGPSSLLAACLQLCTYPIASPARQRFMHELLTHWHIHRIWATIEEHPQLFNWSVCIQSARLTDLGWHMAGTSRYLVRAALGSSDHASRSDASS